MPLFESLDTRKKTGGILVFKDDNFVQSVPVDVGYVDPLRKVVVDRLGGPGVVRAGGIGIRCR